MDQVSLKQRLVDPLLAELAQRDVTVICDDKKPQRYHQCILASYSPVLKSLLAERACCACKSASCGGLTEVVLVLDGFKGEVLMNLMRYIYTGECKVKNRKMILDMIELKKGLGIEVEIDFSVNKTKSAAPVVNNVSDDASTRAAQKRITIAIMSAIEQVNSGVSKILCSECDQCLGKDSFMLHYRNHMQAYSQQVSPAVGEEPKVARKELHSGHVSKHKNHSSDDDEIRVENFSDFLKNKFSTKIIKMEPVDSGVSHTKTSEEGFDDDAETVMQSHGDQDPGVKIDMQDYEKLLRSSIHTLIVARKRKHAKMMKEPENGLMLVSQQDIDEEILKNPRNKEEEYGRLKIRQIYRKLYDRKKSLKSKDKSDQETVSVTDEEMQDEIAKENEYRTVKINIDVKKIKAARSKSHSNSPQHFAVPSTPRRNKKLVTPRKSLTTPGKSVPKLNIAESERKKIYHTLYVKKWNQNQTQGLSTAIHISDEEILREYSSISEREVLT